MCIGSILALHSFKYVNYVIIIIIINCYYYVCIGSNSFPSREFSGHQKICGCIHRRCLVSGHLSCVHLRIACLCYCSKKDSHLLVRAIPMLRYILSDRNSSVQKRVIVCFMQLYKIAISVRVATDVVIFEVIVGVACCIVVHFEAENC